MKYFTLEDLKNTPSRKHKISREEEFRCRARAVGFIFRVGHQLKLKYTTICSASIYFHQFYFRRSLEVHDKYDVASSCLYFASKCEEDRRRLIEVVETCYYFKFWEKAPNPKINKKKSDELCNILVNKELILLQTLEFDFNINQPFHYLYLILNYWKYKKINNYLNQIKSINKSNKILQFYCKIAWFFIYDSLKLVNIVMNATEHIAIACVELSIRYVYYAYKKQLKSNRSKDDCKNGHDFNFEKLDSQNNILPYELFNSWNCILNINIEWFKEFDNLLSINLVNNLCNVIIDVHEFDKDKKGTKNKSKDKNPMYVDKDLLKKPRTNINNSTSHR